MPVPDAIEASHRARAWVISSSPDPDSAARDLAAFERQHPDIADRLLASAFGLQSLVALFAASRFLSEEALRHPDWLEDAIAAPDVYRVMSVAGIAERLMAALQSEPSTPLALALARFRRRQLLRIVIRDAMDLATLSETTEELSGLADAVLQTAYERIRFDLSQRYGNPSCDGRACDFSIIALGKLGGRELNYSSDIDLMFVYSANGRTDGEQSISNREFFSKVANSVTELLSTYTVAGLSYRVDLRLRPDGRHGEVCLSLEGARQYYQTRARDWELQMLIKARVAAGEEGPGRELLDSVQPRIYSTTLDFSAVEAVSATRERWNEKLAARRTGTQSGLDIKLSRGGIRDIEFLVQCLQRLHGGREAWVRHGGTLLALSRLSDKGLISASEYSRLAGAYEFLRHLEHRLQMIDDRQTHALPATREELEILARRMPSRELGRGATADTLLHRLNLHLEEVQELYDRVIHSQQPLYYNSPTPPHPEHHESEPAAFEPQVPTNLIRFLDQRAPGIAATVAQTPLRHGGGAFEAFLEKLLDSPDHLRLMDQEPAVSAAVIDIFENSPWFADELVRRPELVEEVQKARAGVRSDYTTIPETVHDAVQLRRLFRQEMLRIQAESICLRAPIFDTLGRTSDLADAVIVSAYRLARAQVAAAHPPRAGYQPSDQMMAIALGRLGMREFDLGSDADLMFVLPDDDAVELQFWTRVAERMISLISAYTGEGTMFAVDTRLRPNGREGMLVQTVSACRDYIAFRAEAWEGISYMKARCVAGNAEQSTKFLHEVQEVDWRRYGQSGRSRTDLRDMRARLEREQGDGNPLKAGPGGYYDIDFALMYLRLRSAGIFFRVLNTPERIDIIEKMGHLDREDAAFLQDAATLYRAIDHGLRIYSGHAEGRLPQSPAHLDTVANLVRRWTPEHLHQHPLPDELARIQTATRAYFRRLFG
jgi:glutamate-ammonia-ligase adenylyltransferase